MKAILACTPSGGIGYKNKLPWDNLPGDLIRFKQLTTGQVVVMGSNTWRSLPRKPLPNRLNVVVSKSLEDPLAIVTPYLTPFVEYPNVWMIGGEKLLKSSWYMLTEIHLSITYKEYECDRYIDLKALERDFLCESFTQYDDYSYEVWKRNAG